MARPYQLTRKISLELDRILSVAAVEDGIRLVHVDGKQEVIAPLTKRDRDRFFDVWLGGPSAKPSKVDSGPRKARAG